MNNSTETDREQNLGRPSSSCQRRHHPCRKRRRQERRFLVVPQKEEDLANLEDAYASYSDYDDDAPLQYQHQQYRQQHSRNCNAPSTCVTISSSSRRSRSRPLPSTQILISMTKETMDSKRTDANAKANTTSGSPTTTTGASLLLKNFYDSVGMKDHLAVLDTSKDTTDTTNNNTDSEKQTVGKGTVLIDEIDNPSFSTMNISDHKRYLQLTKNSQEQQKQTQASRPNNNAQLRKLRKIIAEEQASYRLALDKFHDLYRSRYLIGFVEPSGSSLDGASNVNGNVNINSNRKASTFCRWVCSQAESINREWKKAVGTRVGEVGSTKQPSPNDRKEQHISSSFDQNKNDDAVRSLPKYYGKVRQTLALHPRAAHRSSLDVQDLTFSVVHESTPTSTLRSLSSPTTPPTKIPEFSPNHTNTNTCQSESILPTPTIESAPVVQLLRNDPKALELAARYSATIVTTSETLETLLRLPGAYSTKWMLPCTTVTIPASNSTLASSSIAVTILDLPIAQAFSSPRACLERGLQEGLYQLFEQQGQQEEPHNATTASETINAENSKEKQNGTSFDNGAEGNYIPPPVSTQFVYSLWTLPSKNVGGSSSSKKPIRVIIRTLVRLKDTVSKLPVCMRARAEYFHTPVNANSSNNDKSRGRSRTRTRSGRSHREIPNSYEKSLWILDQVLFGHQAFCLQYRIDPLTCKIIGWDTTSIAHAFAESATDGGRSKRGGVTSQHDTRIGPLDHWKALIQLLRSIPAIDIPETLLCLPGLVGGRKASGIETTGESGVGKESIGNPNVQENNDFESKKQQQDEVRLDPFSVSVHASCEDFLIPKSASSTATITAKICLDESVLNRAGTVVLGYQALRHCRRDWEWDITGQVPNTFPVTDK